MTPLGNKIFAKALPLTNQTQGGIIMPTKPERLYEVVSCGPKVPVLKPGDTIKPFPHCEGVPYEHEGQKLVIFNSDQLDEFST